MSCLLCDLSDQLWVSCRPLVSLEIRITGDPSTAGVRVHRRPTRSNADCAGEFQKHVGASRGLSNDAPLSTAWEASHPTWFQPRCARAVAVKGTLNSMCVGPAIGVDTVRKGIMIRPIAIMEEGNQ